VDGAKGAGVVRAQILLARAHFSCGEIDGIFGSNFQKAVRTFQGERKFPVTGVLDAATWDALNTDAAPVLINYTLTAHDLKGPFVAIPADAKDQAKLPSLGYTRHWNKRVKSFTRAPN
jgi:peptidoglycan hydrolase-like protein with peptidoglycan-binding domain